MSPIDRREAPRAGQIGDGLARPVTGRNPGNDESFLRRTGQLWKLNLGWTLATLGALLIVAGWSGAFEARSVSPYVIGVCISVAGFGWASITIKCHSCGARLFWKAFTEQPVLHAYLWLTTLRVCPGCRL